jgi:hypothetical protein
MIVSLNITHSEPLAGGAAFGEAGGYLKLTGIARGEIDPRDAAHRGICDLELAPVNERGRVEYACDVFILRPTDPARGNGLLLYEVVNRGRKQLFKCICDAGVRDMELASLEDIGNAFPLRRGYTIAWSGWDATAPRARGGLALDAPFAQENGAPVRGLVRDEFVAGVRKRADEMLHLSYESADCDPAQAMLSMRRADGVCHRIPAPEWEFADARTVRLRDGPPRTGAVYEIRYRAVHAPVLGVGLAATRDVVSYLRYDAAATSITGGRLRHAIAIGFSQAGRYLRDHVALGFNRDESGRRVFDGVLAHTAGAGRVFLNARFGQPFRTSTQNEDHEFPECEFPFSPAQCVDPLTGKSGSLLAGDGSDPLLMLTNSSSEYWQKGASLTHTDPLGGSDLKLPATVRAYLFAGAPHGGRAGLTSAQGEKTAHPTNALDPMPVVRALLSALEGWVANDVVPPASEIPLIANGTLVASEALNFPALPGVNVPLAANSFGPRGDWVHPKAPKQTYRTLVCAVDEDGNEIAGVRTPDVAVPLATYAGWNRYHLPYSQGVLADRTGSCFPFAASAAERSAANDPRRAIAERYPSMAAYVKRVDEAVDALLDKRLLLPEDAERYRTGARTQKL